jgi:xanthine dehydrogenase accessory factor
VSLGVLADLARLREQRVPFVLATVVRAERPTSARPGDRALVRADGTVAGFVGGACVAATLRAQCAQLLHAGTAGTTLLRISPGPEPAGPAPPGTVVVDNPCLSGGTLEIFLEAVLPAPLVQVLGDTPIARALVAVGTAAGYDVRATTDPAAAVPAGAAAVVVASHGHDEPPVLRAARAAGVPYLALVASPKRGAAVLAELAAPAGQSERVNTPAGLDIGARTPGEVAISILAELVSRGVAPVRPAPAPAGSTPAAPASTTLGPAEPATTPTAAEPATAVDPVCGMTVATGPGTLSHRHAGQVWYFCAAGCRSAFIADPARYADPARSAG